MKLSHTARKWGKKPAKMMKAAQTRKETDRWKRQIAKWVGRKMGGGWREEDPPLRWGLTPRDDKDSWSLQKHGLLVIHSITHTASEGLTHILLPPQAHIHTHTIQQTLAHKTHHEPWIQTEAYGNKLEEKTCKWRHTHTQKTCQNLRYIQIT